MGGKANLRYSQLSSPQFSSSSSSSSSLFSSPPTFAQGKSLVLPTPLQTRPDAQSHGPPTWEVGKSGTTHSASLLICWLDSLQFSCYHSLFLSAGYDLPTISRMTPEDLTAIGIQHPGHRKKLKQAISQLNIPDGLPDFLPDSLADWLRMIRLEEYGPGLLAQGYNTVKDVVTISIEDLEDVGFYRLGHQKRLLLAIKKIKDVSQGSQKMTEEETNCIYQTQEITLPSLVPGITRHDKFSSFHQPVPSQDQDQSSFQSQKLPPYCSPYTTYGQQDDLPPPLPEPSSPSQCASTPSDELLPPVPEPMQPLHYSLYRPTTDISQHMKSAPGMFRSHDENLILRRLSSGGGILQPKDHRKAKPVAMVAANARTSQIPYADSCHLKQSRESSSAYSWDKGRQSEMKSPHECQNISLARSWKTSDSHNPHLLRRNSITCLPVSNNMEEVLNVKARNSINTNINNSEETKRLMSKSGPSSPNQTLTRRNRTNSRLSIPDGDKSSYFHGHSSAAQSGYATPERSRSRSAGDVLQDIGSMLSDLTDELDAMLNMEGEQSD